MPRSWATPGLDLHLDVRGPRVRDSLERALREAVQGGRLAPGARLPSSRALAGDLGIARNTVAEAYTQLVAEGWLVAQQGSGTRVAAQAVPTARTASGPEPRAVQLRYDLRAGSPDVSGFPRSEWLATARTAINAAPADAFGYGDPRGRPELRTALAAYLARARGVAVDSDAIIVCSGFAQALQLVGTALHRSGRAAMGVEAWGHEQHRRVLRGAGLHVVPLPVDGLGAQPAGLDELDAALLTPAHQFPLGVALDASRRSAFARWATSSGGVVVEDDYDGEFRFDRRPVGAMQALAPDRIVYIGTASKTLAPGLRLAWMVLPPWLTPAVLEQQALSGGHPGVLDQLTFAEFIRSGRYDQHVRRSRLAYRRRRDQLVATLARELPGLTVRGFPAGLHTVLDLPVGATEEEVRVRAARRGLAVDPLGGYAAIQGPGPAALVVGYGTPPPHAFTGALARLCATVKEFR